METFKYFKIEDFDCQQTGNNKMDTSFIHRLDHLRAACGFPFHITSGYRDPEGHSIEKAKQTPGTHARGIAAHADSPTRYGARFYRRWSSKRFCTCGHPRRRSRALVLLIGGNILAMLIQ
jgi:hypothetical protein